MRGGEGTKPLPEEKAAAAPEEALIGKGCGSVAVIPCGSCLRDGLPRLLPSASSDGRKDLRMLPHPPSWRRRQGSPAFPLC